MAWQADRSLTPLALAALDDSVEYTATLLYQEVRSELSLLQEVTSRHAI